MPATFLRGVHRRPARRGRSDLPVAGQARPCAWLLPAWLLACGGPQAEPPPPAETCPIPVAPAAPSFSADVLPMLRATCGAGSALSCHGTPSPAGHVSFAASLTSAQVRGQLVGVAPANAPPGWKLVSPGDPAGSWLIEKVTRDDPGGAGQASGNRMPYGLPNLCAPTVQTLARWIQLGALDD